MSPSISFSASDEVEREQEWQQATMVTLAMAVAALWSNICKSLLMIKFSLLTKWYRYCEKKLSKKPSAGRAVVSHCNCQQPQAQSFFRELPADVTLNILTYLHPKSITKLACVNHSFRWAVDPSSTYTYTAEGPSRLAPQLWRTLWYRDYGKALMEWSVFADQCCKQNKSGHLVMDESKIVDWKTFYFEFRDTWIDYLLKGYNKPGGSVLVGLYGHIMDFTDFLPHHPGMWDSVLTFCGRDATHEFEDIPHSNAARRIATRIAVIVDKSRLRGCSATDWGLRRLRIKTSSEDLRWTNSMPPLPQDVWHRSTGYHEILPRQREVKRKSASLERIRKQLEDDRMLAENKARLWAYRPEQLKLGILSQVHVFYDPFERKWKGWYSTGPEYETVFCNIHMEQ